MNRWSSAANVGGTSNNSSSSNANHTSSSGLIEPVTRSRTSLFLSIRSTSLRPSRSSRISSRGYDVDTGDDPNGNEESQGLLSARSGSPSHVSIAFNPLPPNWVSISDQVSAILEGTRIKIATLDKLHAKHVLPGFADRTAEEREIESLTTAITKDFRKCHSLIQQVSAAAGGPEATTTFPPPQQPTRHQTLAAQNVQRGLAAQVQDLSGAFRKKQRVYMQKLQGHAIKNQDLLIASGAITLKGTDSFAELEEDVEATRSQLKTQQQQSQAQVALEPDVETRNREVLEIARSIASLAELFKDLSNMVIDQGTILDSVEYNLERTNTYLQDAEKDLVVATKYQRNTGRRKCIFLLFLIIIGLILVLIFKPRRSGSTPTPTPSATVQSRVLDPRHAIIRREIR